MHNRAYYQNNSSLAFQFIVNEYLAICHLFKTYATPLQHEDRERLKYAFSKLISSLGNSTNPDFGCYNRGLFIQLQCSCKEFANCSPEHQPVALKLIVHVEQSIKASSLLVNFLEENDLTNKENMAISLEILLLKIENYLLKIGQLIEKLFLKFDEDEKVLLFLLQNQKALDHCYQCPFVKKLLNKMFSNGLDEAERYIIKQYSQKGYHQLCFYISQTVKELVL